MEGVTVAWMDQIAVGKNEAFFVSDLGPEPVIFESWDLLQVIFFLLIVQFLRYFRYTKLMCLIIRKRNHIRYKLKLNLPTQFWIEISTFLALRNALRIVFESLQGSIAVRYQYFNKASISMNFYLQKSEAYSKPNQTP